MEYLGGNFKVVPYQLIIQIIEMIWGRNDYKYEVYKYVHYCHWINTDFSPNFNCLYTDALQRTSSSRTL